MPVDYSKWDSLELSDDSDIEVHPNVDKRSFIRAKQNKIHQQRAQRKHQIQTLKYERIINDGLITRVSALLAALKASSDQIATSGRSLGEIAFGALLSSYPGGDDQPPPPPEGVHSNAADFPTYSKMMATLMDQVSKALDEKKPADRYQGMLDEIAEHLEKVQDLQKDLEKKLAELEAEDGGKITSENYRTGFDSSQVNKPKAGQEKETTTVELLNPGSMSPSDETAAASSAETLAAMSSPATASAQEEIYPSPTTLEFVKIPPSNYRASAHFMRQNPSVLKESESDGLLVMAFDAVLEGRDEEVDKLVHQALLLQYCRALGRDGVELFLKRITTPGHKAGQMFYRDVQETQARIRTRAGEIRNERASNADGKEVELIQLQAVEPDTVIKIRVPPVVPEDAEELEAKIEGGHGQEPGQEQEGAPPTPNAQEQEAMKEVIREARKHREIFDQFTPELRSAVESGNLDEVNKVLAEMTLSEAEEAVSLLGEANVLNVEDKIIDTTTEEGKREFQEIQEGVARDGNFDEKPAGDPE